MDQTDHFSEILEKFVLDNFFILQNVFLEICKIFDKFSNYFQSFY